MEKKQTYFLIVLILTIVAAVPRFYDLGNLGFYGDEKTTSPPSRSLAEGMGAKMPSGLPYYRAFPHTWLNALSAKFFGLDKEISYRIPSAIIGSLTIPLIFVLARPFFGFEIALISALTLTFSEWHILVSREARMYAPFLFFFLASSLSIWRWSSTNLVRHLILALVFLFAATTFHYLSVVLAVFFLIPLTFPKWNRVPPWQLLSFSAFSVIVCEIYKKYVSAAPFLEWWEAHGGLIKSSYSNSIAEHSWLPGALASYPAENLLWGGLIGAALGTWCVRLSLPIDSSPGHSLRALLFYFLGILSGVLVTIGQLYGAGITCLLFFLIHPDSGFTIIKKIRIPGIITTLIALGWLLIAFIDHGVYDGLKTLVAFPFPYPAFLAIMLPGAIILFACTCIYLVFSERNLTDIPLRASVVAALVIFSGIGVMKEWGGMRYVIGTYPFLILATSVALLQILKFTCQLFKTSVARKALPFTIVTVLSGVLGGHGVPQAVKAVTLDYGENVPALKYANYPDHKSTGEFVRHHKSTGDIVIAEDPLVQHWYSGAVDYSLRGSKKELIYYYRAKDGHIRDIYVNSVLATSEVLSAMTLSNKRVWIITSAELSKSRKYILSDEQLTWLADIERNYTPVYIGRDQISKVYCLNCDIGALQ